MSAYSEIGTINYSGKSINEYQEDTSIVRVFTKRTSAGNYLTLECYAYVSNQFANNNDEEEESFYEVKMVTYVYWHSDPTNIEDSLISKETQISNYGPTFNNNHKAWSAASRMIRDIDISRDLF